MRVFIPFKIDAGRFFQEKLLHWANTYSKHCILDSNGWNGNEQEILVAIDSVDDFTSSKNSFKELQVFYKKKNDWLFGFLSYDLKNETEKVFSENFDGIGFPSMHFFQPKYIFRFKKYIVEIGFLTEYSSENEIEDMFRKIVSQAVLSKHQFPGINIQQRISEKDYICTVNKIKEHIQRGDIYEMNYCMEFFTEGEPIDPAEIFYNLNEASPAPFSALYRMNDKYLMCASPERFLKKSGKKIISQPIKGTAKRGRSFSEDIEIKKALLQNEKEKSENVMIVDLVRNDLSKTCNNVAVNELFGIYTFKQWHQMISTVSGEIRQDVNLVDVIKHSFPMGSMTGAPKVRAMELIEQYEKTKRGLYSGSVGYISPEGDFDFNVVIRSILYNASSKYLSFQVGSAITSNSIPEKEYEECMLKAKGMFKALSITKDSGCEKTNMEQCQNQVITMI